MTPDATNPAGPVSKKVLAALDKELRRKLIDFTAVRLGAERANDLEEGVISEVDMGALDPLHAVYAYAQNKLSVIIEGLTQLPMCAEHTDAYSAAEEEYMPSGPPMSPLTGSYFFCWGVFDSHVGKAKETLGTVAIDLCRRLGAEPSLLRHLKYGLSPNYWNEYVFEAYVNHQSDLILLAGFPDLPATRPHSRVNQAKARQAP